MKDDVDDDDEKKIESLPQIWWREEKEKKQRTNSLAKNEDIVCGERFDQGIVISLLK